MTVRICGWCENPLDPKAPHQRFCKQNCRQWAHRLRKRARIDASNASPKYCGYADPPYPGKAKSCYGDQPTYAGEVDHPALIASMVSKYDGWALSTSMEALRWVLPLCPEGARVCVWVKPGPVSGDTFGAQTRTEALIVVPAREMRPGFPDFLRAQPARHGGDLIGRKPLAFCAFLFQQLGLLPGDTLDDLFPGTGIVGRSWAELSREYSGDASTPSPGDGGAFARSLSDALTSAPGDGGAFRPGVDDASPRGVDDGGPFHEAFSDALPRYRDDAFRAAHDDAEVNNV